MSDEDTTEAAALAAESVGTNHDIHFEKSVPASFVRFFEIGFRLYCESDREVSHETTWKITLPKNQRKIISTST